MRRLGIFLLLCLLVNMSIFTVTAADQNASIVAMVEQFFKVLKDKDMDTLDALFLPETGILDFEGNQFKIHSGTYFMRGFKIINYNYKAEEFQIKLYKDSANVTGTTNMMTSGFGGIQKGMWDFNMFLVKEKKTWKIAHINLNFVTVLKYLLYLPPDYNVDPQKKWPLILYLHGGGEKGNDLEKLKDQAIPKLIAQKKDFPFIIVSPQCPSDSAWVYKMKSVMNLVDEICAKYAVDSNRIYLTGNSMGGYGTWALAVNYPDRFAAIAPICGGSYPKDASIIKNLPIWVFHGAMDHTVSIEESQAMVDALKACGGNVKFTIYPDLDHDSWTITYDNPELYEWFLQQKRIDK